MARGYERELPLKRPNPYYLNPNPIMTRLFLPNLLNRLTFYFFPFFLFYFIS